MPYLAAICTCGWNGLQRELDDTNIVASFTEVSRQALRHSPELKAGLEWPLDRPPDRWFHELGPALAREGIPRTPALAIATTVGIVIAIFAFLAAVPLLVDFLASRAGARLRFLPLPLVTGALALAGLYLVIRALRGQAREGGRTAIEHFARSRLGTGLIGLMLVVPAAWFTWLGANDLAREPLALVVDAISVSCGRSSYVRTAERLFYAAPGAGLPCSLRPGRYQLIVGAATNTIISYLRLP